MILYSREQEQEEKKQPIDLPVFCELHYLYPQRSTKSTKSGKKTVGRMFELTLPREQNRGFIHLSLVSCALITLI